ncbi:MAG: molybdate ABC transporter substrate-binding protein [Oligoflexia bacterium]|nr:molybdate ABC transporter substrate-binding protein [Oligoflexia bacterium]
MFKLYTFIVFTFFISTVNYSFASDVSNSLLIFAGAASKPPTEEIAKAFEKSSGIKIEIIFGGSGFVLSQMLLAKKGDIYFPGSSDFMEIAKKKDVIFADSEKKVVYLVSSINVRHGNPKGIKTLDDLTKPGIKIAIARPDSVCVGAYAVEIIEKNLSAEKIKLLKNNIINYTESCEKTATAITLNMADAVIGWSVFKYWNPEMIETIPFNVKEIIRIAYIPIAISKFTKNQKLAQRFINFVLSPEGKTIFKKHHYFMEPSEAIEYIGASKPVGGEYIVPKNWIEN